MPSRIRPIRALASPLWLAALLVLVVNDHVLKQAFPGWVTGKLSDVAGLLVAPAVLAALLAASSRRALLLAHAAVAAGFSAINLWPSAARAVEALTAATPLPWTITVDPTDLLALPMILVSWRALAPLMAAPARLHPVVARTAFGAGLLACMATSPAPVPVDPPPQIPANTTFPSVQTDLVIANDTATVQTLRVRPLKDTVHVDCESAKMNPSAVLSRALFGPATVWMVDPGRAFAVRGNAGSGSLGVSACYAYLVDGGATPMTLLFWRSGDLQVRQLPTTTAGAVPANTIFLRHTELGVLLADHAAVHPAPPAVTPPAPPGCELPGAETAVTWSSPVPVGERTILAITVAPDGCAALDLAGATEPTRWYVCVPAGLIPFVAGDTVFISALTKGHSFLAIDGVDLLSDTKRLRVGRGGDLVPFGKGDFAVERSATCGGQHDACGSYVFPLEVTFTGDAAAAGHVGPGEVATFGAGGTLYLVRALDIPIGDEVCTLDATATGERWIESVFSSTEVK